MSYIVEYTTLSGKRIPILHKIFESAESAEQFGKTGVTEGNYKDYTVVEAAEKKYRVTAKSLDDDSTFKGGLKSKADAEAEAAKLRNAKSKRGGKSFDNVKVVTENFNEAAPKLKGDSIKAQREKDRAHADAMGRHVKSGRKKTYTSTQRQLAKMRGEELPEGYKVLPPMDREKYQERPGLEGPFSTLSGKVVYYDPKEGSYYDPDTDMYLSYDEFQQLDNDRTGMKESARGLGSIDWPDADNGYSDMAQHAENAIRHNMHAYDAFGHVYSMTADHREWMNDNKDKLIKMFASYGLQTESAERDIAVREADDDRDELTKKLFPKMSPDEMKKRDQERNRAMNQQRFMKPGKSRRSGEWSVYENSGDTYAVVSYNYSDDWGSIEIVKDGETVEDWNDYFGANETGNPLAAKFVELTKKHGIDPTEIDILSGDDEDIHPIRGRKMGRFDGRKFKWNTNEAVAKIACLKCDEVSTAKAWEKNRGFCPKCKTSNQGVAESDDTRMGSITVTSDEERKRRAQAYRDKKAKEKAVSEALTLDYSRYMRSHGKKPRDTGGAGLWMFTTAEYGSPNDDNMFQFQGSFADAKKAAAKWARSQGADRFYVMESTINEAYIKTSKDAINTLGALRKIGKHIETGENTYDGNLANQFANDVYDVISWVENNLNTNDPKYTQILAPVIELRKKAKSMERELGSGKDARFGNQIVNTLYPLMQWIEMNSTNNANEGINEDISQEAHHMERDHEVQMARSDLYKTANYAIKLHSILKGISEEQGLDGWMQAKITKAADYLSSVFHALEYDQLERSQSEPMPAMESVETVTLQHKTSGKEIVVAKSAEQKIKDLKDNGYKIIEEAKKYTPPTQAEITADKKKDEKGKARSSMTAKSINKKTYNETTTAGGIGIATVPMPMGKMIKRKKT